MISHKYKCIFIHIPKCAGTSIETAFGHLDGYIGRNGQDHRTIRMIEPISPKAFMSYENLKEVWHRFKYRYILDIKNHRNKYIITPYQYNTYFKFTFIRNPWARAFSWYQNVLRDEIHRKNYRIDENISLKDFLLLFIGTKMLRPQTYWIKNFSGSIPLDFIGKFENLSKDFQIVCSQLNLSNIKLPHKIKGQSIDYRDYYDQESIELVKKNYKEEIDMFNYTFEK